MKQESPVSRLDKDSPNMQNSSSLVRKHALEIVMSIRLIKEKCTQVGREIGSHAFAIRKLALDPIRPRNQLNASRNRLQSGRLDVDSLEISETPAVTHDNGRLEKRHENDDSSAPSYYC